MSPQMTFFWNSHLNYRIETGHIPLTEKLKNSSFWNFSLFGYLSSPNNFINISLFDGWVRYHEILMDFLFGLEKYRNVNIFKNMFFICFQYFSSPNQKKSSTFPYRMDGRDVMKYWWIFWFALEKYRKKWNFSKTFYSVKIYPQSLKVSLRNSYWSRSRTISVPDPSDFAQTWTFYCEASFQIT